MSQTNHHQSDASAPLIDNSGNKVLIQQCDKLLDDAKIINKTGNELEKKRNKSVAIFAEPKEKRTKWKMVPPDGGWGWLVLFGSTLVNVLVPGTVKSFGVLFVEFTEAFDASSAAAAWIPALCYFLYSSLGPVSSILSLKYSYRTVTLVGGTCAAVGMIMSYFAGSVMYLCISYGIFVGTGAGLSFPPTVYIVTSYFVRLRGVANGLCISGSALGSIILPPVIRKLLEMYGYRGAVLIMGGLTLNVWVAALFYDPVEKHLKRVRADKDDEDDEDDAGTNPNAKYFTKPTFEISTEDSITSLHHLPPNDSFIEHFDASTRSSTFGRSASSAAVQNCKPAARERKVSVPAGLRASLHSSSALHAVPEGAEARLAAGKRARALSKRSPSTSSFQYVSTHYHGSTLTLQPETFASSFSLRSGRAPDSDALAPKRSKFFDVTLLRDPLYLIILISNATNAISYTNFIILLPSFALSLGYDKTEGALLLSIVSAFDLIGRIGGSALSDLNLCPKAAYFIGGLLVSGISLSIMPIFDGYVGISMFCGLFGLASGIYVGVTAVIMADMLGEERLQSTYGISLFVNGILQLIGPPICGIWFESEKSYTSLFTTLGVVLVLGAVIWGFVPFIKKPKDEDGDEDEDEENA